MVEGGDFSVDVAAVEEVAGAGPVDVEVDVVAGELPFGGEGHHEECGEEHERDGACCIFTVLTEPFFAPHAACPICVYGVAVRFRVLRVCAGVWSGADDGNRTRVFSLGS